MQHVCAHFRWIPRGIINCPTDVTNPIWSEHVPRCYVYSEFNPDSIKQLMDEQRQLKRDLRRKIWETEHRKMKKWDLPCAFIVLDDCGFDKRFRNDEVIKELLLNGRHLNILVLIALQYLNDVQPAMRCNADFIFMTREKTGVIKEKLFKNWGSILPHQRAFNAVMDNATTNYGCLVIDNKNNSSSKISDTVASFKADYDLAESDFKMGDRDYWSFGVAMSIREDEVDKDEMTEPANQHRQQYGEDDEDRDADEDDIDVMEAALKNIGAKTKIRVRRVG
jgi:hypothetical protein